ncbi:MAG: DoxX family protein [bacterium]|jgi:putative oxidoreductase
MKKLMSIGYSPLAFNLSMLVLRISMGILMMSHGYDKLVNFNARQQNFYNFLEIGATPSLLLCIFAEFFCALFITIGLFTRLTVIPLIINMGVVVFGAHAMDFFGDAEQGSLYLTGFLVLLLCGPGKISVDGVSSK